MKHDFSNKVIVVIGGTGDLGRVVTKSFLNYHSKTIVVTYRSDKGMQELKTELDGLLGQNLTISTTIEFIKVDVTNNEETKRLISNIVKRHGQIHILVSVVGSYIGGKSVTQLDESEWDKMINNNLKSAFLISKSVFQ